jgi:hypothetical protein
VFTCEPRNDLLSDREPNEAYCLAQPGKQYAVYFPRGGRVTLDATAARGKLATRWYGVDAGRWMPAKVPAGGGKVDLIARGEGQWVAILTAAR